MENKTETSVIEPSQLDDNCKQISDSQWTVTLVEDPETGELILPLHSDILEKFGWNLGDTICWDFNKDSQSYTLSKQ
jgi:hypothetical protein